MPPIRRRNIGRRSRTARRSSNERSSESMEQRTQRNQLNSQRLSRSRSIQSQEERESQNSENLLRMRRRNAAINRSNDDHEQHNLTRRVRRQAVLPVSYIRAAFRYDSTIDYSADNNVMIGSMGVVCPHCKALKFRNESPGLCCASGKIKLAPLNSPPEPLNSLVLGSGIHSTHFLTNIQKYNACFQMTSFGATNIVRDNFMPTFKVNSSPHANQFHLQNLHDCQINAYSKHMGLSCSSWFDLTSPSQIQGQIYHRAGSLLPCVDADHKFLQI